MSMSKDKKARRAIALKRAKRNKILLIVAGILLLVGLVLGAIFLINRQPATVQHHGGHNHHAHGGNEHDGHVLEHNHHGHGCC